MGSAPERSPQAEAGPEVPAARSGGRGVRRLGRAARLATAPVRRIATQATSASLTSPTPAASATSARPTRPATAAEPTAGSATAAEPTASAGSAARARSGGPPAARHVDRRALGRRPTGVRRRRPRSGPGLPVLVIAALMVLIVGMLGFQKVTGVSVLPEQLTAGIRPPPKKFPVLAASRPVSIDVPAIEVRAPVHQVGIAPDGSIGVPDAGRAQEAGWYDQGPTPGQYGPAVIVGHVDTTTGPAVFHHLKEVRAGDRVEVTREDGSVAIFEVNEVERFDKEKLPADEIYGDFSRPSLRLITCGGRWVGGATGYADNVVVFASLVRARTG